MEKIRLVLLLASLSAFPVLGGCEDDGGSGGKGDSDVEEDASDDASEDASEDATDDAN